LAPASAVPATRSSSSASLLERDRPLEALAAAWRTARAGSGQLALVEGEAGIGKTSVVRAFVATVEKARVAIGACDAMTTPRPLGPLVDMMLSKALIERLAGPRTDALFPAVLRELDKPTVLVIEDAHWADAATLDLVRYLARRIATVPALLVITYRDDEVGPKHPLRIALGDLATSSIRRITLERLTVAAVRELASGTQLEPVDLHRRTGGNPFFVAEAVASNAAVPATVRDAILARVARLDAVVQQTIEAIAILGVRVRVPVVAKVLDAFAIEPAIEAGVLRSSEHDTIAFRHELGREAVLSTISPERAIAYHRRALAVLAADPIAQRDELAALVHHADKAGDAAAVRTFGLAAARRAAQLKSHREAAAHYALVARNTSPEITRDHAELIEALAYELYLTGEQAESADRRARAAAMWKQLGDELRHGDNLRWLSRTSWFAGRRTDADRHADYAVAVLSALPRSRELAAAYSNKAQLAVLESSPAAGFAWADQALSLAEQFADDDIKSHALNNRGFAKFLRHDVSEAVADLEASLALARRIHHEEHAARAYTNLSCGLLDHRYVARARHVFDEGIAYCDDHDLDAWRLYMLGWRAMAELYAGELELAARTATEVLAKPLHPPSRVHPLCVLGRVRARRSDPEVWAPLDEALAIAEPLAELQRIGPVRIARAEAAWLAGDRERVRAEVAAAMPLAGARDAGYIGGELFVLARLAGVEMAAQPWFAPPYRDADAAAFAERGSPVDRALLLASTDREPALREAFDVLDALAIPAMSGAIARRLRELGVRSIPRGRRPPTRVNVAGLTAREAEVLDLVAEGLRNAEIAKRLFISTKTVGHHVSAILAKLELPDRAAAARWRQNRE
jgi:DNA-binding CsgD family transcriptional regulator